MIPMFQSLTAHMAWADSTILEAVAAQEGAYADQDLRKILHHTVTVQRFFLSLFQAREFDFEREKQAPESIEGMQRVFAEAHADAAAYAARLDEDELSRKVSFPRMPEFHASIRDSLMQVLMHSEHHRAQCAMRLRELGGKPPVTDYIIWVRTASSDRRQA
ncbi:MAG TPA: DinB family protein [Bryobacteraceae bacterium]|nr:DinB family protein [Bryobacteraceae bacterium]